MIVKSGAIVHPLMILFIVTSLTSVENSWMWPSPSWVHREWDSETRRILQLEKKRWGVGKVGSIIFPFIVRSMAKLSNHFSNLIDGKGSNTTLQILSVRGVPSKDNIGAFGPKSKFLSEGRSYRKGGNTNPLFLEYFLQQKKLCLEGSPSPLTEKICKRVFNILLLSTLRF